ncbi:MAG: DeoR/GlpR transcriptional regulator [Planctomycetaceae bacterium]|nr:DeoR/GlpR transcriptional regulator [Planctomycetaceae bacterium]
MLLDQRRQEILNVVEHEGFVALMQLVDRVGVSESTVRRDLEYLERIGQIRRTRGGAAYVGESLTTLDERAVQALPQKQAVGRAAGALVSGGETVLLDGGTTTLEVARNLGGRSLQVVTNSLPVATLLANQPQIELITIGGYVYPKTGVALGPLAIAALSQIHVKRLFMSVGGITEKGLYNSNTLLAETERSMLAAAEEVIVVTDSSKLGHSALVHLCPLDRVHRIVVDAGITDEWKDRLTSAGIALTLAEV